ncbi:MAG TPA: hypothetical protein VIM30_04430 [Candidatus Limnocylindrales bacterium]|jgi:hypothetical protein
MGLSDTRNRFRPPQRHPRSIVELIRLGTIDAELAGLLWLLVEARFPVTVAALVGGVGKSTVLGALLMLLPPGVRQVELGGVDETFVWLSGADPSDTYLVAAELSNHFPAYTWGAEARTAIQATGRGFGLGATIHADSLEEVFDELRSPGVGATEDELSWLGLVVVVRAVRNAAANPDGSPARRIVAAHYLRPFARDAGGHIQRLPPAVLATWDPRDDSFEHFAWGVISELALRAGRKSGEFELEVERRREYLAGLAAAGVTAMDAVASAISGYRDERLRASTH